MVAEKKYELISYRLVAIPDHILLKKLVEEQKQFQSDFGEPRVDTPTIELAVFSAKPEMEATLSRWIGNICALQDTQQLQVINYNAIPPHSLYVRVNENGAFTSFFRSLKMLDGFITSNDCPPLQFCNPQGILLAGGMAGSEFESVANHYARKTFHEYFTIEKILLLRREADVEVIASSYQFPMHVSIK